MIFVHATRRRLGLMGVRTCSDERNGLNLARHTKCYDVYVLFERRATDPGEGRLAEAGRQQAQGARQQADVP